MQDLNVSRLTATKYLEALTKKGFLVKEKIWRANFYINMPLFMLLKGEEQTGQATPPIVTRRPDHV